MDDILQSIGLTTENLFNAAVIVWWIILAIIVAKIISAMVWKLFRNATFIKNAFRKIDVNLDMQLIWKVISKIVYFIIIFAWVVWVLNYLNIEINLINNILDTYLPRLIFASVLSVLAWFLATILRAFIIKWSDAINLDAKIWQEVKTDAKISESLWTIGYWSVIVFFLPQILEKLWQTELLKPIQNIIDQISSYIPNIISAVIAFVIWLFIAKILKHIVVNLLTSVWADKASEKFWLKDFSVSNLAWTVVYAMIIIPTTIQALKNLNISVISDPATQMLQTVMDKIPQVLFAWVIIAIAYFVWKFISNLISELLSWVWFNKILGLIWINNVNSNVKPSDIVAKLVFVYIMLLAIIEATSTIWFYWLEDIVNQILWFSTNIIIWVVILWVWLYIANMVSSMVSSSTNSKVLPMVAKVAIIVLTWFMWLQQMWIGWDIINLAFTLILWSLAVAFAIAVWLWSRDVAWEEVKKIIEKLKK